MRTLSKQIIQKYIRQLKQSLPLTDGELRAIKRAINFGTNSTQLHDLLMAAENCNCETSKGTLIGFDSQYSFDLGTEFIPKFKTGG